MGQSGDDRLCDGTFLHNNKQRGVIVVLGGGHEDKRKATMRSCIELVSQRMGAVLNVVRRTVDKVRSIFSAMMYARVAWPSMLRLVVLQLAVALPSSSRVLKRMHH